MVEPDEVDPELIRKLVGQEVRARLKGDKGDRDAGVRDWFAKMGIDDDTAAIRYVQHCNAFQCPQDASRSRTARLTIRMT